MPDDAHSRKYPDIRWKQRLANYQRAYAQLAEAVALSQTRPLSRLEQQGLIQAFEFTQELAWQTMKDYFAYQGISDITGSRDAIRAAFKAGLIEDGDGWMDTIQIRNRSSHTYDEATAKALAATITQRYLPLFEAFGKRMEMLAAREN
ncbi:MAG: nucleotidyltransferase substrate binding protein [Rhodocyclaceae bacterium]|jgi:nucleotidyltransferase substrate binding protein (TIGR01987 family)|nr:nucleotidyltransferase substrate binding protein [Rhodocyclaceae bacterium]